MVHKVRWRMPAASAVRVLIGMFCGGLPADPVMTGAAIVSLPP